jgi:hypothetical protein
VGSIPGWDGRAVCVGRGVCRATSVRRGDQRARVRRASPFSCLEAISYGFPRAESLNVLEYTMHGRTPRCYPPPTNTTVRAAAPFPSSLMLTQLGGPGPTNIDSGKPLFNTAQPVSCVVVQRKIEPVVFVGDIH